LSGYQTNAHNNFATNSLPFIHIISDFLDSLA
jgi:hypothetical protein